MAKSALALKPQPIIHVLLVEDNASDAFIVESLLDEGHSVTYKTVCVHSHAGSLSALAEQTFDVCLLDLTLPDSIGFSALIDIQDKAPDMPVLILTGVNDMELAKNAVGRGAQDYLLKDEIEIAGLARAIDYAIERKCAEKDLFQRANCDALTKLANRASFLSRLDLALARAKRSGMNIAVLFIDLDRFKPINDTHGHDAGDEVLKTVAKRIQSTLRAYDTPARFGGDEFAVLLEGMHNARDAAHVAQKIIHELSASIPYSNQLLQIGASIGIAFSDEGSDAEFLIKYADTAMYHAKRDGGGVCQFYEEHMHDETLARLTMEKDLKIALEANELRLYYQPYVNPDGEAVIGIETLLRWAHPERGFLSAHEFLSAAEAAKLMPQLTKWQCSQLRHDIAMWNAHSLPPLVIALNLSISQLEAPDLLDILQDLATEELLGNHRLAVEIPDEAISPITESRFLTLAKLHELAIGLHLDHFGMGSLPLTGLCSIPFSLLKLNIALTKNMSSDVAENVLINAAIMLAHHLGMKAGAIGVESPWQADMLKAQNCDTMQGYLTVHPMNAAQLIDWFKTNKT